MKAMFGEHSRDDMLTLADREYIRTAPTEDLRDELRAAREREDRLYAEVIAHELLRRTHR